MIGFFWSFGYSCAFLKDLMFYVFGDIGFLGTVAQFRVGHTSERSRDSYAVNLACVDHLEVSLGPFKGRGVQKTAKKGAEQARGAWREPKGIYVVGKGFSRGFGCAPNPKLRNSTQKPNVPKHVEH